MDMLQVLREYFPMAVFTGKSLILISEQWRVEITEHHDGDFSGNTRQTPVIRLKICKKAIDGDFLPGHHEDFQIDRAGELAEQIEKYVQSAIGANLKENI